MYSLFVNRVIACIREMTGNDEKGMSWFCEGISCMEKTTVQEYALLRGSDARYFINIIYSCKEIFDIEEDDYRLEPSRISGVKYQHTCYPKNIRRWLNGTVSRKKRCRVELVALVICWATDWGFSSERSIICVDSLGAVCSDILGEKVCISCVQDLADALWRACLWSYENG